MSLISNCCSAPKWLETDLCSQCKEHADFYDENVLQIEDLTIGLEYRTTDIFGVYGNGRDAITFPIGHILIYKGEDGDVHTFETKDGIKVEIEGMNVTHLEVLEEVLKPLQGHLQGPLQGQKLAT